MSEPNFNRAAEERIEASRPLSADQAFEVLRREGEGELRRPLASLAWSGFAAGLAMGFSVIAEAAMLARLPPDSPQSALIADFGYTIGFLIVVLGRLQLFTEQTLTPVLPICYAPTEERLRCLARLWGTVLAANLAGATVFALFMMNTPAIGPEMKDAVLALGRHAAHGGFFATAAQGVGAGFLVAALVWMLANGGGSGALTTVLVTYVIALAGFAHVIAGSVEMMALVSAGRIGLIEAVFGFILPALIGNMIGGTVLFAFIAYGQIRRELDA